MRELAGRVVLATGTAQGLEAAVCDELADATGMRAASLASPGTPTLQ